MKVKITEDHDEYYEPAEFNLSVQGVIGLGGYIQIKEKNLVSIEFNARFGFTKVPVSLYNTNDARLVAFQFIVGYLRRV